MMRFARAVRCSLPVWLCLLLVVGGCARMPNIDKTFLRPKSLGELEGYVLRNKPALDLFRASGPFDVERRDDRVIPLTDSERIEADLFIAGHAEAAPLVIFLHGHGNTKTSHGYQAMHVASWGMHGMTLQLPAEGPWIANGRTLARIVEFIQQQPDYLGARIDAARIILVGHSFGGTAVAIALAEKARVSGAILLDPAGSGRDLPNYLRRIAAPVLVLGADERVSAARNRDYFFRFIRNGVAEVSITDASHEDAQFPADGAQTTEALQITFASAITSAAFSLSLTRRLDHVWGSFQDDFNNGKLLKGSKK